MDKLVQVRIRESLKKQAKSEAAKMGTTLEGFLNWAVQKALPKPTKKALK